MLEVLIDGGADIEVLDLNEDYLMAQGSTLMVACLTTTYPAYKT